MKRGQTQIDSHQIICVVYEIGTYSLTLIIRGIFLARLHNFWTASDRQSVDTHQHIDLEGLNLWPCLSLFLTESCSPDVWDAPQQMGKQPWEHRPQQSRPYRAQSHCHTPGRCCPLLHTSWLELRHKVLQDTGRKRPQL